MSLKDLIANRKTLIKNYLNEEYCSLKNQILHTIKQNSLEKNGISFTTDFWTDSLKQLSYISLTIHFINNEFQIKNYLICCDAMLEKKTGENILLTIENNIKSFLNLSDTEFKMANDLQPFVFVTDNGANILKALKNYNRISCVAHNLNLIIEHWFKNLGDYQDILRLINYCKDLVVYFKRSGLNYKLTHSLKQSVITRWNSLLTMFKSIDSAYDEIIDLLKDREEVRKIYNIDRTLLTSLIELLSPIEQATIKLSFQDIPTLHLVLPWQKKLINHFGVKANDCSNIIGSKNLLMEGLESKFVIKPVHQVACFLDPRMKHFKNLLDEDEKAIVHMLIKSYMNQSTTNNTLISSNLPSTSKTTADSDLNEFFSVDDCNTDYLSCEEEFLNYLHFPVRQIEINVLDFWKEHEKIFPRLAAVCKQLLGIPATSTPSERVFSLAGHVLQKRRNQLSAGTLNNLLFLKFNQI